MTPRRRIAVVCLALIAIFSHPFSVPKPAQAAVNDGSSFILGAWQHQADIGEGVSLAEYEASLNIRFTHHKWYVDWDQPFPSYAATYTRSLGKELEITWQPWVAGVGLAFGDIAAGNFDAYIRQFARESKAFSHPILLALAPEMDGWWSPWAINGDAGRTNKDFIAGYRRVVDIFREEAASNVSWVWAPNVQSPNGPNRYKHWELYPGDDYVTYMGLDGYNWGTTVGGNWESFEQVFRYSYTGLTAISDKNILIMEVSSAEEGGSKEQWIRDMFTSLKTFPKIVGFTWFNRLRERDWRIHSTTASKRGFIEGAAAFFTPPATGGSGGSGGGGTVKATPTPTAPSTSTPTPSFSAQPSAATIETKQQPVQKPTSIPSDLTTENTPQPSILAPIPEIIQTLVNEVTGFWRDGASASPGLVVGVGTALIALGAFVVPRNRRRFTLLIRSIVK